MVFEPCFLFFPHGRLGLRKMVPIFFTQTFWLAENFFEKREQFVGLILNNVTISLQLELPNRNFDREAVKQNFKNWTEK